MRRTIKIRAHKYWEPKELPTYEITNSKWVVISKWPTQYTKDSLECILPKWLMLSSKDTYTLYLKMGKYTTPVNQFRPRLITDRKSFKFYSK